MLRSADKIITLLSDSLRMFDFYSSIQLKDSMIIITGNCSFLYSLSSSVLSRLSEFLYSGFLLPYTDSTLVLILIISIIIISNNNVRALCCFNRNSENHSSSLPVKTQADSLLSFVFLSQAILS